MSGMNEKRAQHVSSLFVVSGQPASVITQSSYTTFTIYFYFYYHP